MIQKRIKTAKIGVLDVDGDYAIIGNDPYSLLQSMFGLEITGLLHAGECYHRFWIDKNVHEVVAFRAPMTSIENVCKLNVVTNPEMKNGIDISKLAVFLTVGTLLLLDVMELTMILIASSQVTHMRLLRRLNTSQH